MKTNSMKAPAGIVLPAEGERFNTETNTDPRISKVISFALAGKKLEITLSVPLYINGKLKSEDWDFAEKLIREYAEHLHRQLTLAGTLGVESETQLAFHVKEFANRAIYNQFMKYQVRAGNHEGHEVPENLG